MGVFQLINADSFSTVVASLPVAGKTPTTSVQGAALAASRWGNGDVMFYRTPGPGLRVSSMNAVARAARPRYSHTHTLLAHAEATRTRSHYSRVHTRVSCTAHASVTTRTRRHYSRVHTRVSCTAHASVMRVRSTSLASGVLVPRTRL